MRVNRFLVFLGLLAVATLSSACSDTPTSASTTPGYSQTDVRLGSGAEVVTGSVVTVQYTGWLFDATKSEQKGLQFDTSRTSDTPFSFPVGFGQVIEGWDQGLIGMRA